MSWGVYAIFLLVAAVLDSSFMQVFQIGSARPSLVPVLVVFVGLHAQRSTALWAAFIAGLLVDLTNPIFIFQQGVQSVYLIGPTALGFVFGTHLVLPLRGMVVRRNPLALGALTVLFCLITMLVTTAIFSARGWYAGTLPPWLPANTALRHMGGETLNALATGGVALLAALPLNGLMNLFGFASGGTYYARRA